MKIDEVALGVTATIIGHRITNLSNLVVGKQPIGRTRNTNNITNSRRNYSNNNNRNSITNSNNNVNSKEAANTNR